MPREKPEKKAAKLQHEPLQRQIEHKNGKLKEPKIKVNRNQTGEPNEEEDADDEEPASKGTLKSASRVAKDADTSTFEDWGDDEENDDDEDVGGKRLNQGDSDEEDDDDEGDEEYEGEEEEFVELDGENFAAAGVTDSEEALVQRFLQANAYETRTLADIIMDKIKQNSTEHETASQSAALTRGGASIPPKVAEVYTAVGKLLHHYTSGKLPKALKMLPHLRNWEEVLWLTRPDEWSPCATYACTRIFASNLNAKMAQRFYNLVLLEKCRDDIKENKTLNYHLYMALKKSVFKPAAFYKGILLPLMQSQSSTLREATIFASVIMKVSIPGNHSAAVLLKLAEMPYSGTNSLFIKVLLNKKYALPKRVIDALVNHFTIFEEDSRQLPVIWHQALLAFAQRYKTDLEDLQRKRFKNLLKVHSHHLITPEIRRELFSGVYSNTMNGGDDDDTITVISKKSVKSTMSSTKMLGQRATVAKNSMEMDV